MKHLSVNQAMNLASSLEKFLKPKIDYSSVCSARRSFYDALILVDEKFRKMVSIPNEQNKRIRDLLYDLWCSKDYSDRVRCLTLIICFHYRKHEEGVDIYWKGTNVIIYKNMNWDKILELIW